MADRSVSPVETGAARSRRQGTIAAGAAQGIDAEPPGILDATGVANRAGGENFPVALRILPAGLRSDLLAIYGAARLIDEAGDGGGTERAVLDRLDWLDGEIDRAMEGRPTHPVVARVAAVLRHHALDAAPLHELVAANRQDQVVHRYGTWDELLGYCRLSAAPVGRLVLGVVGARTPERIEWSDSVCHGLQVLEHLQDVHEDAAMGRVYLPQEDLEQFGCSAQMLLDGVAPSELPRVVAFEATRVEGLLAPGSMLARSLAGWPKLAVAGFVAGGRTALDELGRGGSKPRAVPQLPGATEGPGAAARRLRRAGRSARIAGAIIDIYRSGPARTAGRWDRDVVEPPPGPRVGAGGGRERGSTR